MSESQGEGVHWSIFPQAVQDIEEGQVHVDVIVESRLVVKEILHLMVAPEDGDAVSDGLPLIAELCGAAISATNGLSCPAALNLVHQFAFAHRVFLV